MRQAESQCKICESTSFPFISCKTSYTLDNVLPNMYLGLSLRVFEIVFDTFFHNEFGSSEEILLAGGSGWTEMMAR